MNNLEKQFIFLLENVKRQMRIQPLNLGGSPAPSGGAGGPPGGFIGWLPQTRVSYDITEAATMIPSYPPPSGVNLSLLDNLNHIRYRLGVIEDYGGLLPTTTSGIVGFDGRRLDYYQVNVPTSGFFTTFSYMPNSLSVSWNGLTQSNLEFQATNPIIGHFNTLNVIPSGSVIVADYMTYTSSGLVFPASGITGGGGLSEILVLDSGVPVGSGITTLNFGTNLNVTTSGLNTVTINSTASGGGGTAYAIQLWHNGQYTNYAFSEAGFTSANSAAVSGDIIKLPPGNLTVTSNFSIGAGIILDGSGQSETTLTYNGTATGLATTGSASSIQNMTIDTTFTGSLDVDVIAGSYSYFKNLILNIYHEPSASTFCTGISGDLYTIEDEAFAPLDNIIVNYEMDASGYSEGCYDFDVRIATTDYEGTVLIKDCHAYGYATYPGYMGGIWLDVDTDNTKVILKDCTSYLRSTSTGDGWEMTGCYIDPGYGVTADIYLIDCVSICENTGTGQWYTYSYWIQDCTCINCFGAAINPAGDSEESVAFYTDGCTMYNCIGIGTGTNNGFGHDGVQDYFYGGAFYGTNAGLYNDSSSNPIYVSNCYYNSFKDDNGGMTFLNGDRANRAEQFLTLATSTGLDNERVLTAGDGISGTDGGAGSTYTLAIDLPYGSMYTNSSMGITMTSQDTWYEVDAATAWTQGKVNDFTFTDPRIKTTISGVYQVNWNLAGSIDTADQGIEAGIMKNGSTMESAGQSRFYFLNSGRNTTVGSTALVTLGVNEELSLAVRNITSAGKVFTAIKGNLTASYIGG